MMTVISGTPDSLRICSARARGFTVIELLVTLSIFGILIGTAISNTKSTRIQIATAQSQIVAQMRIARMKAITSVSHYTIFFTSTTQFKIYPMTYNGTTWQIATTPTNVVTLPPAVLFPSTQVAKAIEFNSRGMIVGLSTYTQVTVNDKFGETRYVQAWPLGQVYAL